MMRAILGLIALQAACSLRVASLRVASFPARKPRARALVHSEAAAEEEQDGKRLVTLESLDDGARDMIEDALALRNRERILSGQPKYESVEAMINAYIDFEGREAGMTDAQCEDAVLRFLQRRSLMAEGADGISDPQTAISLALLVAIVLGMAYQFATGAASLG